MLVLLLRVSVHLAFGQELRVTAKVGPVKIPILPKPEKAAKKEKKTKKSSAAGDKKKPKITFSDARAALPVLLDALNKALKKTRRKMRIDPLQLCVTFGGDDPAKVAETYGWANTAMWTLMPRLEQLLRIPDPHIHLEVDYNSFSTRAEGEVGISFRIGEVPGIALTLVVPLLRWYLDRQKGKAPETSKEQTTNV